MTLKKYFGSVFFSKNQILTLVFFGLVFPIFSQKYDESYFHPDSDDNFVSIYLNVSDLNLVRIDFENRKADKKVKTVNKKTRNKFNYFAFRITANTIFYDDGNKTLIGNFISMHSTEDSIHFVMSQNNGDILLIDISNLEKDKKSLVIKENKRNGKTLVYTSDNCLLERKSR